MEKPFGNLMIKTQDLALKTSLVRSTTTYFGMGVLLAFLFLYLYYPISPGLVIDWWTRSEYSHGFLIPFITGYLIWARREQFRLNAVRPSVMGFGVFALGTLLYLLAAVGKEEFLMRVSMPLTLIGLIYFIAGAKFAKICLFPIGYLLFMIPVPYTFFRDISLVLRFFDAKVSAGVINRLGIPLFREGYVLHLPNISLEVADACSGVFSIVSLLALGIVYIERTQTNLHKKIFMWASIIPIAVFVNVVRIVTITVLVYGVGEWVLETTFHKVAGTFNFLLGFLAIVYLGRLLNRRSWLKEAVR